jgi:hypothetical protein
MNCSSEIWLGISGMAGTQDGGEKGIVVSYATETPEYGRRKRGNETE